MSRRALTERFAAGGALAALVGATVASPALSHAAASRPRRPHAAAAARRAPAAPRCVPGTLNLPAELPGTNLSVAPLPGSYDASPATQISLLGAPVGALSGVSVRGSRTGAHRGSLRGYSQGDGASFVPTGAFAPGELVTVRGKLSAGGQTHAFNYSFAVATPDPLTAGTPGHRVPIPKQTQHYRSRPDLQPPAISVTARSAETAPGYLFATPYSGPGPSGPMIFDEAGNLVWFDPLPAGTEATNLQVQQLDRRPVLSWWQGNIPPQGFGQGEEMIANNSYRVIIRVRAGNGYRADLHDFHITQEDTALMTVFSPIACNLRAVGGPAAGAATDGIFQELDLRTGLVRREWHSLDHVGLGESYSAPATTSTQWPFDYFHINSIDQGPDGTTLISARNTSALYELSTASGQVLASIGGRHSTIALPAGARTAYQHDATDLGDGVISVFDNGAAPKVHPQSRGLVVQLDSQTNSGTLLAQYEHPTPAVSAGSQGNIQLLPNKDVFVGWGAAPYFSEFSPAGQLLFDAHMHGSYESYRVYRFPWEGAPSGAPAIAAIASGGPTLAPAVGPTAPHVTVYASWSGDTRTASWRVLAGASSRQLTAVATAARAGFETVIATPGPAPFVAVQALAASGAVLGVSPTIRG